MTTVQSIQVIKNAAASSTLEIPVYTGTAESMTIYTSNMAADDAVYLQPIVNGFGTSVNLSVIDLETLETVNEITKNGCYAIPCVYGYDGIMFVVDTGEGGTSIFAKSCRTV